MAELAKKSGGGKLVILSSPSGGGKTSICNKLLTPSRIRDGWHFSISYTTRGMRPGEKNGREYHFVDGYTFERMAERDEFAEHFQVHQYNYGTPRAPLERVRRRGGVMVLDVDVKGARRLKEEYPDAISIFILPPSTGALRKRLTRRGTETKEQLEVRFKNARDEMRTFRDYGFDYVVINKELGLAVRQVLAIIEAHPCRVEQLNKELLQKLAG